MPRARFSIIFLVLLAAFEFTLLIDVVAGAILIQFANLLRVVTLFHIGCRHRAWFETFHLAVWQTVIFALAAGFFIVWSRRSVLTNAPSF